MSISWAYFRPQGPPRRQALQNQLPECPSHCARLTRQEGSIMSISWAYSGHRALLGARRCKTNCPSHCAHLTRQEGRIMSISWAYFRPQGPPGARRCKTNCPSHCAHLTRQEGSIMSISWAYFRPQGPPRRQELQNQLPESLRAFDEAGGQYKHQLGIFPATRPS